MPMRPAPRGTRKGDPIDPKLGSDWLSNLSRFRDAELRSPHAAGRMIMPKGDEPKAMMINPDDEDDSPDTTLVTGRRKRTPRHKTILEE